MAGTRNFTVKVILMQGNRYVRGYDFKARSSTPYGAIASVMMRLERQREDGQVAPADLSFKVTLREETL